MSIEIKLPNGNILHLPETAPRQEYTLCDCHVHMGNDFFFLPRGQCLREDKTCNEVPRKP
jgi:hypothetical protein